MVLRFPQPQPRGGVGLCVAAAVLGVAAACLDRARTRGGAGRDAPPDAVADRFPRGGPGGGLVVARKTSHGVHGACSLPTLVALGGGGACRGRACLLVARTTPCTRRLDPEPPEDLACRTATLRGESGRRGARQFGYSRLGVPVGRRRARSPHARQRAPHAPGGVRVDCRVGVVRVHRLGSLRHGAQSARGHRLCGTGRVGLFIDGLRLAGAVRCPRLRKPWGGELDSVVGDVRILHRERGVARGWPQQAAALPSGKLRGVLTGGSQLVATACPCRPCVFGGGVVLAAWLVPPGNAPAVRDGYAVCGDAPRTLALYDGTWRLRTVRPRVGRDAVVPVRPVSRFPRGIDLSGVGRVALFGTCREWAYLVKGVEVSCVED